MIVVILALGAALCLALGSVLQQRAASQVPAHAAGALKLVGQLVRRPLWLAGMAVGMSQYGLQAAALGMGSLVIVEPLLVTSLLFALPIAATLLHRRLSARDWAAALLTTGGIATFLAVSAPHGGRSTAATGPALVGLAVGAGVALVMVILARRARPHVRGALLGVAGGVGFGLTDAMSKATIGAIGVHHAAFLLGWQPWVLAVVGVGGLVVVQHAYHAAPLQASLPATNVLEPLTGSLLGIFVFGEHLRGGGWTAPVEVVAALVMAWGVVALARSPLVTGSRGAAEVSIDLTGHDGAGRRADAPAGNTGADRVRSRAG